MLLKLKVMTQIFFLNTNPLEHDPNPLFFTSKLCVGGAGGFSLTKQNYVH